LLCTVTVSGSVVVCPRTKRGRKDRATHNISRKARIPLLLSVNRVALLEISGLLSHIM